MGNFVLRVLKKKYKTGFLKVFLHFFKGLIFSVKRFFWRLFLSEMDIPKDFMFKNRYFFSWQLLLFLLLIFYLDLLVEPTFYYFVVGTRSSPPEVLSVKSHFGMGVLLQTCCLFSEHVFLRTPLEGCFHPTQNYS